MKYAIIAVVFVFALAQGSLAQDQANLDLTQVSQTLEVAKNKVTEELNKLLQSDISSDAQAWIQKQKTELEAMAPDMQDQMRGFLTTMEEKMRPLQPLMENFQQQMTGLFQTLSEKLKPASN